MLLRMAHNPQRSNAKPELSRRQAQVMFFDIIPGSFAEVVGSLDDRGG